MAAPLLPVPRCGALAGADGAAYPLAGSGFVWFDRIGRLTGANPGAVTPASALAPSDIARLSGLRPPVCGLSMDRPRIMGILNLTPDSFSDGGELATVAAAVARARAMHQADILDIGGESTRPGAAAVPVAEEIRRTAPVIRAIRDAGITTPISIDTRKAKVADAALAAGADMVNDVSALRFDPELAAVVAAAGVPLCLMHAQGNPETMQINPQYDNVLLDVYDYLAESVALAETAGINRAQIVADPGIGFGKTLKHNLILLRDLTLYHSLGVPLLLGLSRKKFIGTIGQAESAKDRMPGSVTGAVHGAAMGVQILRVHDVTETFQALALWQAIHAPVRGAKDILE